MLIQHFIVKKVHFWRSTFWEFAMPLAFGLIFGYYTYVLA